VLDDLGLTNTDGRISWPLGLRVLPPGPDVQKVRQNLDVLLAQAASGTGDARTLDQISDGVVYLRALLADKGQMLARNTVLEAQRFLDRLDQAVKQLKG
jgi:hypothetical protein